MVCFLLFPLLCVFVWAWCLMGLCVVCELLCDVVWCVVVCFVCVCVLCLRALRVMYGAMVYGLSFVVDFVCVCCC